MIAPEFSPRSGSTDPRPSRRSRNRRAVARPGVLLLSLLLVSGVLGRAEAQAVSLEPTSDERIRSLLATLAHDSLRGRMTGTPGARSAARILAAELRDAGVQPAGDDEYFQHVPLRRNPSSGALRLGPDGRTPDDGAGDSVRGINVVGLVPGTGSEGADEAVVVGAHYDHLGIGPPEEGDSIYNGADDDASGVVAVVEAARSLAAGDPPRRTVVILLSTGEEVGLLGTRWYLEDPVVPLERTVANLQVEMIGRPDPLLGGPGRVWLTGFHRSTMGEMLRSAGVPVEPDPRPSQQFFLRSDNVVFAREGIPAHTLSSYGMHEDYHTPHDEADRVAPAHLVAAVGAVVESVRILAHGEAPRWIDGGRPAPLSR